GENIGVVRTTNVKSRFVTAAAGGLLILIAIFAPLVRLATCLPEQMAELGKAWPLIEGSGTIYGMFVIESLSQTKTEFFASGMPR
ncbi:phage tail protein, partial [Salmonella enterica subsp. enterica serovar Montevideo]|nr:phage tail protein [Salmonella enterica subsp. enterica serovar Montevideo]